MAKVFKEKNPWKNEDNEIFSKKMSTKFTKMLKFINVKPENFKNKEKVKLSKDTLNFMSDEVIFSIMEAQRDGILVGDKESYISKDMKLDYETKLSNLAALLNDYKKSIQELFGETSVLNLEAYMSAKEIILDGNSSTTSIDYHMSVLEEYVKDFPDDVYNLPWLKLALSKGNKMASELSCNA